MKKELLPLNIELLMVTPGERLLLKPITTIDYYEGATGQFSENGLFSTSIFGRMGEKRRDYEFARIPLSLSILHPVIYKNLCRLKSLYKEIMEGRAYAVFDEEAKDFVKSSDADEKAGTGYEFFTKHILKLTPPRNNSLHRSSRLDVFEKYKPLALQKDILVLPAGLRDLYTDSDGRVKMDDINKLYQRLIALNQSLPTGKGNIGDPEIYDRVRLSMQNAFNDIYAYLTVLLDGKSGVLQSRLASRRIFDGTRGVITSYNISVPDLRSKNHPSFTDAVVGIYQLARGILPKVCYYLSQGILYDVFDGASDTAQLVDKKTLKKVTAPITAKDLDNWYSIDGYERIVGLISTVERRHKPVIIAGHYLALVFNNGKYFKIFRDVDELPEQYRAEAKEHVHPLTYIELVYYSGYKQWNEHKAIVTRYPVTGMGSTIPCGIYVKTTDIGCCVQELDGDWLPIEGKAALEAPVINRLKPDATQYHDTIALPVPFLAPLGADYDGDTVSLNVLYAEESLEEVRRILHSRRYFVSADGKLAFDLNVRTLDIALRTLTGPANKKPKSE